MLCQNLNRIRLNNFNYILYYFLFEKQTLFDTQQVGNCSLNVKQSINQTQRLDEAETVSTSSERDKSYFVK
jgi:hypothetical protein